MSEKYIFIGGVASEKQKEEMKTRYGRVPVFSSDPLQVSLLQGLSEILQQRIEVLNLVFYPTPRKLFRSDDSVCDETYAIFRNIPFWCGKVVQHFSKSRNLFKYLKKLPNEKTHIVVYSAYFPFLKALWKFKKTRKNIDICLIVPDLPKYSGLDSKKSFYKNLSTIITTNMFDRYNNCVDSYVMLSKHMNDVLNPLKKKNIVMEGIAPSEYEYQNYDISEVSDSVLYSGTLQFKYGIKVMLDAIELIPDQNIKFDFYGDGEAKQAIIELSQRDPRVSYHSPINRTELNHIQQKAKILVNPRQNNNVFTKYSFPSKNIEYLLSGRPVIAYKLDGIPDEYDEYFEYPKDNSAETLASTIIRMSNCDDDTLNEMGHRGREFVLSEKNFLSQAKRIIKLINCDNKGE